jgi:secreted trypsin-like serine protease
MAAIWSNVINEPLCGAALLTYSHVLTAGHCVANPKAMIDFVVKFIYTFYQI